MRVAVYEDGLVDRLEPLSLTRPVYELLCGTGPLLDSQRRAFAADEVGVSVRPGLAAAAAEARPGVPVNDVDWLTAGPVVVVNARWLPPADFAAMPPGAHVGLCGGRLAYASLTPRELCCCDLHALESCLRQWGESLPAVEAGGQMLDYPWDLVDANADRIAADAARLSPGRRVPAGLGLVGPAEALFIDATARIDPMTVADTTRGPVIVAAGAAVKAFTRLEGPCYIGPETHLQNAQVRGGTSVGPHCRVGGEVEASIIQGYTNKYHDGFLGHSFLGEWVNFGAGTHTSDLRNDYGDVNMTINGRRMCTGRRKVGSYVGDHAKTGLGALLNTGTNAGPFASLLPSGELLPKYVPAFARVSHGRLADVQDFDELVSTAEVVMGRRGRALTPALREVYRRLHAATEPARRQAVRDGEARLLRRSA